MLQNLLLRRAPQYFLAQNPVELQRGGDFNYVCINLYPSYEGESYQRAMEDPVAVLTDPSLTTTMTVRVDRTSLRDFVLSSGDSAMPHAIERWNDDVEPDRCLLNEVR